jgi:hypothetical protein
MKLYEAFFLSLIFSLFAGALLFFGIPLIWHFVADGPQKIFFYLKMPGVVLVFYLIYVVIQFLLSIINLLQVIYLRYTVRLDFDKGHIIRSFLFAELTLYLIVFVVMLALIDETGFAPVVLLFSIPYVICCTISIFFFRYFLKKLLISDVGTSI